MLRECVDVQDNDVDGAERRDHRVRQPICHVVNLTVLDNPSLGMLTQRQEGELSFEGTTALRWGTQREKSRRDGVKCGVKSIGLDLRSNRLKLLDCLCLTTLAGGPSLRLLETKEKFVRW